MVPSEVDDYQSKKSSNCINKSISAIIFVPEVAYGSINQCIGLGAILRNLDYCVAFATESTWKDKLSVYGFEEYVVGYAEQSTTNEVDQF
ncbi:unnamed protein product [Rotaria magnacalcarata]|uniref:Uncharacterized protein n=1 Tax=Rotaria magnacalcarata TaxID=392030 RepID=A0A815CWI6_9BILA|nr:unnamed protein product [Rotaria magnacalcarata]CAF4306162.1 unnamed protein product [Rotaria magnacalcarata]